MQLALSEPALVDRLVVADIAPVEYQPSHHGVFEGLSAVAGAQCKTRQEAATLLAQTITEPEVVQFLLLSLMREGQESWRWRLNHEGLRAAYPELLKGLQADYPFDGETLFIRGELSAYVSEAHIIAVEALFAHFRIETLGGVGHWLHAEKPGEFNRLVKEFLL